MRYPLLFTPMRIGPVESRNRIVMGAHFTMYSEPNATYGEPGFYGERYGRYLAEAAAGGTGVIVAGQAQVHPTTAYQMHNNAAAWDPASVAHFRRVTEPVHAHGALAFLQLAHNGGVNHGTWSRLPVWAASDVANHMEAPTPIEPHQMREVVEHFARSARHAADGGFDGIEVHAAHGYLLHEFFSPKHNRRRDEYGGSLDNRMRFAREVLAAVRDAVGPEVAVGVRLVADEETRDGSGLGPDDCAEIACRLAADGLVDYVNASVGTSGVGMVRPMHVPHLVGVPATAVMARAMRARAPHVPVLAVHRILTPDEAEGILANGDADGVTLARALIADPEWAAKARDDRADEIRRCTGCNQGCYGNLTQGYPITCVTNPGVGRESALGRGTLTRAPAPRRVVVVGGGPAGLEAAWVAAARGHSVVLLERSHELGGRIRLAQRLPGRAELTDFADWRIGECARRGVEVHLRTDATVESILAFAPDAVLVATGGNASIDAPAKSHPFPLAGGDQPWVIDHERAIAAPESLGARVVVLDAVGDIAAL
ncbi:MAG TPA: NAD(P)-binding protein, partial [Acidimicrobiia bacterium]|nr:NAD(P)-binding protein [Acidimicrobiia bacterium]